VDINYKQFTTKSPNPLRQMWIGRCTIYEYQTVVDETNYQSTQEPVPVLKNEPCRLSYNWEQATNLKNGAAVVSQSITLFIRPDITIKPGSLIEITQHGVTEMFERSGHTAVYTNHQEVKLQVHEDYA